MNNIEKQLNNLPKGRLSRRADLMIRYKLTVAGLKQSLTGLNFNLFAAAGLRPVIATVVILVLVFSGATSAYAYNSDQVTRASILYPVKRGLEQIESRFATTPAAQVKFHNKLAERRIAEAQFLSVDSIIVPADQSGSSTGEMFLFKLKHENEFNDTLRDADDEIDRANERAGEISDRTDLDRSLALLSDAHLYDLEKIKDLAESVGMEADDLTTDSIAMVLNDIKYHQQKIVRAISQFDGDLKRAGENDGSGTGSDETEDEHGRPASTTPEEAASSLNRVKNEITDLETELSQSGRISSTQIQRLSERLNKKINQAETAIQDGDLNKFNGLLRATEALTNNGEHFLKENKQEIKATEQKASSTKNLPSENSGEKLKAQFNQSQLRRKQEAERKRQEELRKKSEAQRTEQRREEQRRKEEAERNSESNRDNVRTDDSNRTATSGFQSINNEQVATSSVNIETQTATSSATTTPIQKDNNDSDTSDSRDRDSDRSGSSSGDN